MRQTVALAGVHELPEKLDGLERNPMRLTRDLADPALASLHYPAGHCDHRPHRGLAIEPGQVARPSRADRGW